MQCPICLGDIKEVTKMPCCGNSYCQKCISQWLEIRNVCPLCCTQTKTQKVNALEKRVSSQNFDDGSLMIQTEIAQIKKRITSISKRVQNKLQQSGTGKSSISSSLVRYLEKQLRMLKDLQQQMDEHTLLMERALTVQSMQLILQTILDIQNALQNNVITIKEDYQLDYEDYQEDDDQYSDYQQEQMQVHNQKKNGQNKCRKNVGNHQNKYKAINKIDI